MACVNCQQYNLKVTHGQEPKIQGPFEENTFRWIFIQISFPKGAEYVLVSIYLFSGWIEEFYF